MTLHSKLSNLIIKVCSFILRVYLSNSVVHAADIKHDQNVFFFFQKNQPFFLSCLILTKLNNDVDLGFSCMVKNQIHGEYNVVPFPLAGCHARQLCLEWILYKKLGFR